MEHSNSNSGISEAGGVSFRRLPLVHLSEAMIAQRSAAPVFIEQKDYRLITPHSLETDSGIFINPFAFPVFPPVTVLRQDQQLLVSCTCNNDDQKLCSHEAQVLTALLRREEFGAFFFPSVRKEKLQQFGVDYGLGAVPDPDDYFVIRWENNKLVITPKHPSLQPVNADAMQAMNQVLFPVAEDPLREDPLAEGKTIIVVLKQHKYNKHLLIEICNAPVTKEGKIKNPITAIAPLDLAWTLDDPDHLKFYTAIHKFQNHPATRRSASDLKALKAIIKNPARYRFYIHNPEASENITAASVKPVKIALLQNGIRLTVSQEGAFYSVTGKLLLAHSEFPLKDAQLRFNWFLQADDTLLPQMFRFHEDRRR